jgi:ABC-type lipoprotein release transport system permease subunit
MWLILRLAIRNLLRNRRRSILTLLAIFIPIVLLDFSWGFTGGFERSLFEDTVRLQTGHIQIHEAGYKKIGQTIPIMRDVRPVLDAIATTSEIAFHTIRLDLPALAASGSRSKGVLVQGVEPSKATEIGLFQNWIQSGRYLSDADKQSAVIGKVIAKELDLDLETSFVIVTSHPELGTAVLAPSVVGIMNAPIREANRAIIQITLGDARALAKSEYAATSIVVMVHGIEGIADANKISIVADSLRQQLGADFVVETWNDLAPEIMGYLQIARPILLGFMLVFFLLAGLVVLNTIYLNLLERTKEIGIIIALGAGRRKVMRMIAAEAFVLSGVGGILGTIVGAGLVLWGSNGIALPESYRSIYAELGINPNLTLSMSTFEALLSAFIMIGIALLAAWLPARRAAKMDPTQAMRAN